MTNWAYIEDGNVKETYDILPDNWRNISNFNALKNDVNYLKSLNWVPVIKEKYTYDIYNQKLDNRRFRYNGNFVVEEYDVVDNIVQTSISLFDIENILKQETSSRLDIFAQSRGYDNILSACTYANDINLTYRKEGQYCLEIRSETWTILYSIIADIKSNQRPIPKSHLEVMQILQELPRLEWPE